MKNSRNNLRMIFTLVACISFSACSTIGNNTDASPSGFPRMVERAKKDKQNLLLHSGLDTFLITSVVVEKSRQDFTVHLNKLDSINRAIIRNAETAKGKQLHIYMRDSTLYTLDEPHTIPFAKVSRITSVN